MIVCRFHGGLGNQMFQYAAARALALKHDTTLVADSRAFQHDKLRPFLIDRLQTVVVPANTANLAGTLLPPEKRNPWNTLWWRLRNRGRLHFFRERNLAYQPSFETLGDNTYLRGYWQSEKYFAHIGSILRSELRRDEVVDRPNQDSVAKIRSCLAVSMHIRRGDYVTNPKTFKVHGVCSLEYYARAAQHIADRVDGQPTFFVFSDDPDWAREHLKLPFETAFISHNQAADPWADLMLMSVCQHHIIANSSFSWWGAWLNPSPDKIVAACRNWFADPKKDDRDLVPENWVRL